MTTGKDIDAGTARLLRRSYANLVKAGHNSVRAAWRFGQTLDSLSDKHTGYTQAQLAEATGISTGTIYKYRKFYGLYQTPELAVQASEELETYDVGILIALFGQTAPPEPGRPLAGRHWRYFCRACRSHDVGRVEVDEEGNPVEEEAVLAGTP
jgi:transcriptional regulator with XRE-family HTH domain